MNKVLLDTHVLLWWGENSPRLKPRIMELIKNTETILISSVSLYELYTKNALGKLDYSFSVLDIMKQSHFEKLNYTFDHAERLRDLALHHRDPFDRMLITQALSENIPFITADKAIWKYEEIHIVKA